VLKYPTTNPPTIPEMIPENKGAPEAIAIPKHSGKATKKTTKPAEKSDLRFAKKLLFFVIILYKFYSKRQTQNKCVIKMMYYIVSGGGITIFLEIISCLFKFSERIVIDFFISLNSG
jgi:hypothetical protein